MPVEHTWKQRGIRDKQTVERQDTVRIMQITTKIATFNNQQFVRDMLQQFSPAQLKQEFLAMMQTDASPQQLAKGFAVGTFISILPIPGLDFLLATLVLAIFKQLNKMAIFSAFAVWNTIVVAPLYVLCGKLGALLFTLRPLATFDMVFGTYVSETVKYFVVGNLVMTLGLTAVSYLLVQTAVAHHQNKYRKNPCKVAALS